MTDLILAQQEGRLARARRLAAVSERVARRAEHWARLFHHLGGLAKYPTTGNALLRSAYRRSAFATRLNNEALATLAGAR